MFFKSNNKCSHYWEEWSDPQEKIFLNSRLYQDGALNKTTSLELYQHRKCYLCNAYDLIRILPRSSWKDRDDH